MNLSMLSRDIVYICIYFMYTNKSDYSQSIYFVSFVNYVYDFYL